MSQQMLSNLNLYSIDGIDSTYENVMMFDTIEHRNNFMENHLIYRFNECYYIKESETLVVDLQRKYFYLKDINYMSFYNEQDGFITYAFIDEIEYINEECSRVYFSVDVITTHWFSLRLKESLIDRCHQPRWDSSGHLIEYTQDEGLNFGEYIIDRVDNICNLNDNYIICSSDALGQITGGGSGSGSGSGHVSTIRKNVYQSACKLLGLPYRWGGNYPPLGSDDGTDCSGLCQWAYNDNGITIGRTTYDQILEGEDVDYQHLRMGDLIFTRGLGDNGHVVMFKSFADTNAKTYNCIEAKQTGTNIMENVRTWTSETCARNILGNAQETDIELPPNDKLDNANIEQFKKEFVYSIAPICINLYREHNIYASVQLAQAIEESGWGQYAPGNNYFGIKADEAYKAGGGEYVTVSTQEEVNGELITIVDDFRKYDDMYGSAIDHMNFLLENSRYSNLPTAQSYQEQCRMLQEDGYATNSNYADNLINIINSFDLFNYDF